MIRLAGALLSAVALFASGFGLALVLTHREAVVKGPVMDSVLVIQNASEFHDQLGGGVRYVECEVSRSRVWCWEVD